jgi:hypothetical protein
MPNQSAAPATRRELRQGLLARAFDDPHMQRYQHQSARRRLTILQAVLSLILLAVPQLLFHWHMADPVMPFWAFAAAAALLYIPWMFVTGMLNGSVYGIFDLRSQQLDEVELRQRDAAYRTAYLISIWASLLALGAIAGNPSLAIPVISVFLFLHIGLPRHIAAWRMTDDVVEPPYADPKAHDGP